LLPREALICAQINPPRRETPSDVLHFRRQWDQKLSAMVACTYVGSHTRKSPIDYSLVLNVDRISLPGPAKRKINAVEPVPDKPDGWQNQQLETTVNDNSYHCRNRLRTSPVPIQMTCQPNQADNAVRALPVEKSRRAAPYCVLEPFYTAPCTFCLTRSLTFCYTLNCDGKNWQTTDPRPRTSEPSYRPTTDERRAQAHRTCSG